MTGDNQAMVQPLLTLGQEVPLRLFFGGIVAESADLILSDPYAFCLAVCLDRGMKAEIVWTIPYWIKQDLGHLDPYRIHEMTGGQLAAVVARLPKRPRYVNDAPRTISDITDIVVEGCEGDAARIWTGRSAADVREVFEYVHGVGTGIANMAVLLIERAYGVRFSDLDRRTMDIKPDVHTMRVLARMGAAPRATPSDAIAAARRLHPSYPGEIDAGLWLVGRQWCTAQAALCHGCPLEGPCPRVQALG